METKELNPSSFTKNVDGKETTLFMLQNKNNVQAFFTNYGARWVSMLVPDRSGVITDVITGFDNISGYINSSEPYYGAVVGRYANRIAKGKFFLEGIEYTLAVNNPPNHLHGGLKGFHAVVWDLIECGKNFLKLQYNSGDMEEGYPGKLTSDVHYELTDENEIKVAFKATTNKTTVINLAHHAYFNLNGKGKILDHSLMINADTITPIDPTSIPLGSFQQVEGTAFDFREHTRIGARIHEPDEQLINGTGYDHNFVLNSGGSINILAAEAQGDVTGITMNVFTTEPGLQLYTGNFMNNENTMKGGIPDGKHEAFCLETQHYPDSPNNPEFPSVILRPGDIYRSQTIFKFTS